MTPSSFLSTILHETILRKYKFIKSIIPSYDSCLRPICPRSDLKEEEKMNQKNQESCVSIIIVSIPY